jgi:hypothetical protein
MHRPTIAHALTEQLLVGYRPTIAHAPPTIAHAPTNYCSCTDRAIIGRLPSNYWSVTHQLLITSWAIIPHHVIPTIGHTYDYDLVQAE